MKADKYGDIFPKWRWQDSAVWGACLVVSYIVLASLPVVLAFILNPPSDGSFLRELGKGAALLGFALLTLQVVLSARFKFVDRPFGLDIVMQFHKGMAILAGMLLLLHPVLLAISAGNFRLFVLKTPWQINLGKIALVLLLIGILLALLRKKIGIQYQVWRFMHKGMIFVVILGFIHSIIIGSDLRPLGMKVYWWLLFVMAGGIFLYRNIFVPLWGRRRFRIVSVQPETHDTYTVSLEPEDGFKLRHCPGQFMFLKLQRPRRSSEEHPFTISSSPTREYPLTATIKKSGDFTNTIDQTKPGDKAGIEAPYGRFSFVHHNPKSFVFIAGGVGITPIMSMLRYLKDTGDKRPVTFIYGNKTEKDIIFRDELDDMPEHIKIIHVLEKPSQDWSGLRGYVTKGIIKENADDILDEADVYLCGPPIMMNKVIPMLRSLGVEDKRIDYERFSL